MKKTWSQAIGWGVVEFHLIPIVLVPYLNFLAMSIVIAQLCEFFLHLNCSRDFSCFRSFMRWAFA